MSLINKMLQDLDARGSRRAAAAQPNIKPVVRRDAPRTADGRHRRGGCGGSGAGRRRRLLVDEASPRQPRCPMRPAAAATPIKPVPAADAAAQWLTTGARQRPRLQPAPAAGASREAGADAARRRPQRRQMPARRASAPRPRSSRHAVVAQAAARPRAGNRPPDDAAPARRKRLQPRAGQPAGWPRRRSDCRARAGAAIDPRHDAARQTLVGLLIEGGRKGRGHARAAERPGARSAPAGDGDAAGAPADRARHVRHRYADAHPAVRAAAMPSTTPSWPARWQRDAAPSRGGRTIPGRAAHARRAMASGGWAWAFRCRPRSGRPTPWRRSNAPARRRT